MGFLKKLKKRGDHAARLAKRKEERRTEAAEERQYFRARNEAERLYLVRERSRFLTQVAYVAAIRETFGFGAQRLLAVMQKAVLVGDCCLRDKMFTLKELRDQLELETGYDVPLDDVVKGEAFGLQQAKAAVDEVTIFYLWALNDLYKMRKRRLARAYAACEQVSKAFADDHTAICRKVQEIEDAGLRMHFNGYSAMELAKLIAG